MEVVVGVFWEVAGGLVLDLSVLVCTAGSCFRFLGTVLSFGLWMGFMVCFGRSRLFVESLVGGRDVLVVR